MGEESSEGDGVFVRPIRRTTIKGDEGERERSKDR